MPIYVYECSSCGERFEYSQSIKDPPKTVCENCSGKLEKVIVPIAFHLKGGGWYKDLYSSQKAKSGGSGSPGASEASGSTSDAKSEPKGDGKAESNSDSKSDSRSDSRSDSKSESKSDAKAESKSDSKSDGKSGDK